MVCDRQVERGVINVRLQSCPGPLGQPGRPVVRRTRQCARKADWKKVKQIGRKQTFRHKL